MARRGTARKTAGYEDARAGREALASGAFAEAAYHLGAAVQAAPRDAGLRAVLAEALARTGAPAEAIDHASVALALEPRANGAARLLSGLLLEYELTDHAGLDGRGLRAAMAFSDVDRTPLARTALTFLKETSDLGALLDRGSAEGWDTAAQALLAEPRGVMADPVFLAALAAAPVADPAVEFLLTAARARLLADGRAAPLDRPRAALACALIAQGLANEYVWATQADEDAAVAALAVDPAALAAGDADACRALLLGALYAPPERWLDPGADPATVAAIRPRGLRDLVAERLAELREEAGLAADIEAFGGAGAPDDRVSRAVREQYEDSPYPRWTSTLLPEAGSLRRSLGVYFAAPELAFFDAPFRVLIAGCGTGEQLVHAARGYGPNARVDGIDLSRASLAYAERKTRQIGLENTTLRQADILALDGTTERWDVIESVGVLHHMAEPFTGWRILTEALKPGGLMYIGLYSAVARQPIRKMRETIAEQGLGDDSATIRRLRRALLTAPEGSPERGLARSADFNTASNVRDLLFHRHEAPVTIEEIARFTADHGLEFRGFDLRPHIADAFKRHFGAGADERDLTLWSDFERDNPTAFDGMFLFWCRKSH